MHCVLENLTPTTFLSNSDNLGSILANFGTKNCMCQMSSLFETQCSSYPVDSIVINHMKLLHRFSDFSQTTIVVCLVSTFTVGIYS